MELGAAEIALRRAAPGHRAARATCTDAGALGARLHRADTGDTLNLYDISALAHADLAARHGGHRRTWRCTAAARSSTTCVARSARRRPARRHDPFGAGVDDRRVRRRLAHLRPDRDRGAVRRGSRGDHRFDAFAAAQRGWLFGAQRLGHQLHGRRSARRSRTACSTRSPTSSAARRHARRSTSARSSTAPTARATSTAASAASRTACGTARRRRGAAPLRRHGQPLRRRRPLVADRRARPRHDRRRDHRGRRATHDPLRLERGRLIEVWIRSISSRIDTLIRTQPQVRVGVAQSPWSLPLPSPASPTTRSSTWAPVTSTSMRTAACLPADRRRGDQGLAVGDHAEGDRAARRPVSSSTPTVGGEPRAAPAEVELHVADRVGAEALGVGDAGDGDRAAVAGGLLADAACRARPGPSRWWPTGTAGR